MADFYSPVIANPTVAQIMAGYTSPEGAAIQQNWINQQQQQDAMADYAKYQQAYNPYIANPNMSQSQAAALYGSASAAATSEYYMANPTSNYSAIVSQYNARQGQSIGSGGLQTQPTAGPVYPRFQNPTNAAQIAYNTALSGGNMTPELIAKSAGEGFNPSPYVNRPVMPEVATRQDIAQYDRYGNPLNSMASFEAAMRTVNNPYGRSGFTNPNTLGDLTTQRLLSGVPLSQRNAMTGSILEAQRYNAYATPGQTDDRFFNNELQKWGENFVEQSSAYHHAGLASGLPTPANPFEYQGDLALAFLKGGSDAGREHLSTEMLGALPSGIGLQQDAWQRAINYDRGQAAPEPVSFMGAVNLLNSAEGKYGQYGSLWGGPEYKETGHNAPQFTGMGNQTPVLPSLIPQQGGNVTQGIDAGTIIGINNQSNSPFAASAAEQVVLPSPFRSTAGVAPANQAITTLRPSDFDLWAMGNNVPGAGALIATSDFLFGGRTNLTPTTKEGVTTFTPTPIPSTGGAALSNSLGVIGVPKFSDQTISEVNARASKGDIGANFEGFGIGAIQAIRTDPVANVAVPLAIGAIGGVAIEGALGLGGYGVARLAQSGYPVASGVGRVLSTPLSADLFTAVKYGVGALIIGEAGLNIYNQPTATSRGTAFTQTASGFAGFAIGSSVAKGVVPVVENPYAGREFFSGQPAMGPIEKTMFNLNIATRAPFTSNPAAYRDVAVMTKTARFIEPGVRNVEPNIEETRAAGPYADAIRLVTSEQKTMIAGSTSVRSQYTPEIVKASNMRVPNDIDLYAESPSRLQARFTEETGMPHSVALDIKPMKDIPGFKNSIETDTTINDRTPLTSRIFGDPYERLATPRSINEVLFRGKDYGQPGSIGETAQRGAQVQVGGKGQGASRAIEQPLERGYRGEKDVYDHITTYDAQKMTALDRGVPESFFKAGDVARADLMGQTLTFGTEKSAIGGKGSPNQKTVTRTVQSIYDEYSQQVKAGNHGKTLPQDEIEPGFVPSSVRAVGASPFYASPISSIIGSGSAIVNGVASSSSSSRQSSSREPSGNGRSTSPSLVSAILSGPVSVKSPSPSDRVIASAMGGSPSTSPGESPGESPSRLPSISDIIESPGSPSPSISTPPSSGTSRGYNPVIPAIPPFVGSGERSTPPPTIIGGGEHIPPPPPPTSNPATSLLPPPGWFPPGSGSGGGSRLRRKRSIELFSFEMGEDTPIPTRYGLGGQVNTFVPGNRGIALDILNRGDIAPNRLFDIGSKNSGNDHL